MKYGVSVTIHAAVTVDSTSFCKAEDVVNEYITNMDFGNLKDIDWETDCVVDEDGNCKL